MSTTTTVATDPVLAMSVNLPNDPKNKLASRAEQLEANTNALMANVSNASDSTILTDRNGKEVLFPANFYSNSHQIEEQILQYQRAHEAGKEIFKDSPVPLPFYALMRKKEQEQKNEEYHEWIAQNLDWDNMAEVEHLRSIEPEFFTIFGNELERRCDQQKYEAQLALYGPRSKQDLLYTFQVQRGEIEPMDLSSLRKGTKMDDKRYSGISKINTEAGAYPYNKKMKLGMNSDVRGFDDTATGYKGFGIRAFGAQNAARLINKANNDPESKTTIAQLISGIFSPTSTSTSTAKSGGI